MYENNLYIIEQDLAYSYITNKNTLIVDRYLLEDKNLIEIYIKVIKSCTNHEWGNQLFKEFICEQIEISHQVNIELEERKRRKRH